MNIRQFLIIFWARRMLVLMTTISCLAGALIVCAILPPRWQSSARVMLDFIKPDPVTGQILGSNSLRAYVDTQTQLVTDYTVAGKVAEQVGWLSDPQYIELYNQRPASDQRDFRRWLADIVISNTTAKLLETSNILEIQYTAPTAIGAKNAAEALRKGFMDASLEFRHEDAERNAVWYTAQLEKAKQALDAAVSAQASYERANNIVLGDNKFDLDSARLQVLNQQGAAMAAAAPMMSGAPLSSPASVQLAGVEAQISSAEKILGPNNPEIQDLQAKRAALAILVERDKASARSAAGRLGGGGAGALESAVSAQKAKVIAQSEQIGKLDQLQQDVELRRDEYNRDAAKVAQFRQEAAADDAGVTPLGNATTPSAPEFPNYWLIVPGATILGLSMGVLVGLLMELLARKIRSADDLEADEEAPFIGAVPGESRTKGRGVFGLADWWPLKSSKHRMAGA